MFGWMYRVQSCGSVPLVRRSARSIFFVLNADDSASKRLGYAYSWGIYYVRKCI